MNSSGLFSSPFSSLATHKHEALTVDPLHIDQPRTAYRRTTTEPGLVDQLQAPPTTSGRRREDLARTFGKSPGPEA